MKKKEEGILRGLKFHDYIEIVKIVKIKALRKKSAFTVITLLPEMTSVDLSQNTRMKLQNY